jgi:hypothetical protein
MRRFAACLTAVWMLLLSACQHAPEPLPSNMIAIADGITLQLTLPEKNFTATQKITARYRNPQRDSSSTQETQNTLLMQVQASPQNIVLAGLAPSGTRLFSLQFDGNTTEVWKSPLFSLQQINSNTFDARYALADFELTAFEHNALQRALSPDALLIDTVKNGVRKRELQRRNGETIIHIEYRATQTEYCHRERHYCLLIENLP